MEHPSPEQAIEVPIDALPHVDEHSIEIGAGADRTWEALIATLPGILDTRVASRGAGVLGCAHREANGEPSVIGSTLPGFVISRSVRPALLAMLGQHRFSRYALVFTIDDLAPGRSRLNAETRADFPGAKGRGYRRLVIGTGGHVRAVRRILEAVRDRAGGPPAVVNRQQIADWISLYIVLWRTPDTDRLGELFSERISYSPAPYEKPHVGLDAVKRMWEAERDGPDEPFEITTEVVAVEQDTGVARVEVRYGKPHSQEYRDLWVIRLDQEGKCIHFEEWPFWPRGTAGTTSAGASD